MQHRYLTADAKSDFYYNDKISEDVKDTVGSINTWLYYKDAYTLIYTHTYIYI